MDIANKVNAISKPFISNAFLPEKMRVADSRSYLAMISFTSAAEICSKSSSTAAACISNWLGSLVRPFSFGSSIRRPLSVKLKISIVVQ